LIDTEAQLFAARILIVDDEPANVKLLQRMLKVAGYRNLFSTTDPRQACDLLQEQGFDLLLLDLRMPRMDGIQVMESLNALTPDGQTPTPVLVLTAESDPLVIERAQAAGARGFLMKPYDRIGVLNRIRTILASQPLQEPLPIQG
jgi:putative two-component system response regulator